MNITDIADALDRAPRQGAAADDPEGSRLVFSDTAFNRITQELRLAAAERVKTEAFGGRKQPGRPQEVV